MLYVPVFICASLLMYQMPNDAYCGAYVSLVFPVNKIFKDVCVFVCV